MAKIQVLHNYGGVPSSGRRILPGVYDANDAALFGLAQYLLDNGHAQSTDMLSAKEKAEQARYNAYYEWLEINLDAMTVAELKAYAAQHDIGLTGHSLKADIVNCIENEMAYKFEDIQREIAAEHTSDTYDGVGALDEDE